MRAFCILNDTALPIGRRRTNDINQLDVLSDDYHVARPAARSFSTSGAYQRVSFTSRKPRLSGGTPTAQPPLFGFLTKALIAARCFPDATGIPQEATLSIASPSLPSVTRWLQLDVHSQTLPPKSARPYSFSPKLP